MQPMIGKEENGRNKGKVKVIERKWYGEIVEPMIGKEENRRNKGKGGWRNRKAKEENGRNKGK